MEKRAFERVLKKLEVKFWSGGINYTGITTNISENGMFIGTKIGLPPGALLDIKVILPTGEVLRIPVRVKRILKPRDYDEDIYKSGMGVQLAGIHPRYVKFIRGLKTYS